MSEVIYKKCSKCGTVMTRDVNVISTSGVPKYRYTCSNCGCEEYDTFPPTREWKKIDNAIMTHPDEWELFRREAARDILCVLLGPSYGSYESIDIPIRNAITYADELIKQLRKEK